MPSLSMEESREAFRSHDQMIDNKNQSADNSQVNELAMMHKDDPEDFITMKKNFEETEGEVVRLPRLR